MVDASTQCYYLDAARNQQGPVSAADLARLVRSGTISRDTLIWFAGMPDWRPAGQVNELASLFGPPAGPPPIRPPMPPAGAAAMRGPTPAAGYGQPNAADGFEAPKSVGFGSAIAICFRKYVVFRGRAGRPEFWWWTLFELLILIAAVIADTVLLRSESVGPFYGLSILALLLPSLAVQVRRLHDTDRSGWWLLLGFVPFGGIVLLVFFCMRGTEGPNRFGPQVAV